MKNIIFYISIVTFFFLSCDQKVSNKEIHNKILDTVKVYNAIDLNNDMSKLFLHSYYEKFGIIIPNYYLIIDSLSIDLNNDNIFDNVILLSPITLEVEKYALLKLENDPNRILVELITQDKISKIRNIYCHQVSNIGGVLSKYNGMIITDKGFEILHESGSRYSWAYTTEYSTHYNDSIFLFRIEKVCAYDGIEKKLEYFFNKKSLQELNVSDSIDINCNCDKLWMSLQDNVE
jgi:hypothetical protein